MAAVEDMAVQLFSCLSFQGVVLWCFDPVTPTHRPRVNNRWRTSTCCSCCMVSSHINLVDTVNMIGAM